MSPNNKLAEKLSPPPSPPLSSIMDKNKLGAKFRAPVSMVQWYSKHEEEGRSARGNGCFKNNFRKDNFYGDTAKFVGGGGGGGKPWGVICLYSLVD